MEEDAQSLDPDVRAFAEQFLNRLPDHPTQGQEVHLLTYVYGRPEGVPLDILADLQDINDSLAE